MPSRKTRRGRRLGALHDRQIARREEEAGVAIWVGNPPLAAVVDLKAAGCLRAPHGADRGVDVVIHDLNTRVDRLHHFPIDIIEMIDRVLRVLMQHRRLRIR